MKQYETSEVTVVNIGIPQMGFRSKTVHCVFSCFLMRFVHAVLLKSSTKKRRENTGKDPCIIFKSSTQSFQIIPKHWKNMKKSLSTAHAALGSRHHDLGLFPLEAPQLFLWQRHDLDQLRQRHVRPKIAPGGPESWVKSCRNPQLENWNTELEDLLICDMDFYRLTMVDIIFTYTYIIYIYIHSLYNIYMCVYMCI